jgi:alpha-ribazole phosphatase
MEIFLIRHTAPAVSKGTIYGRTDVPLASTFQEEKDSLLRKLPTAIPIVYSSPSSRCMRLAGCLSKNYITDERLYEVNFGLWEGRTWDTVDQEALASWMEDYVHVCPPEGESMIQMQARVMGFWNELLQRPQDKTAVVTHGGVIRIILATLQSIPLIDSFNLKIDYGDVFLVRPGLSDPAEDLVSAL